MMNITDKEKETWERFSEQRKKELMNPEFAYLHHNSYEQMAWFQFLQNKWSVSSLNTNPFNIDNELEYSLRVHNFGPDIRQISNLYSSSFYLNKINQPSSQQPAIIKSTNPRPSFYTKGSQFGQTCYKKYNNIFMPNCPKKSDAKFSSPFAYFADRRIKVIEKEKPNIKKSLLLPEIVHEWESLTEDAKGQIRNIWENYITLNHQLYQQEKEEKNIQVSIRLNSNSESLNNIPNVNDNLNTKTGNGELNAVVTNKLQLTNELKKTQDDLDKIIDSALKD